MGQGRCCCSVAHSYRPNDDSTHAALFFLKKSNQITGWQSSNQVPKSSWRCRSCSINKSLARVLELS